jgi:hypothetical protein
MTRATFVLFIFSIARRDSATSRSDPHDLLPIRARISDRIGITSAVSFIAWTHPLATSAGDPHDDPAYL